MHTPQVREAIPAVSEVRRYALLGSGQDGGVRRFLACCILADGDAAGAAAALMKAGTSGAFAMSPAYDSSAPPEMFFLESPA